MFSGLQNQLDDAHNARNEEIVTELASLINNEVILAGQVNPGYNREFYLPSTIDSEEYNITLIGDYDLIIDYRQYRYLFFLDGNGSNICPLKPGLNSISNTGLLSC